MSNTQKLSKQQLFSLLTKKPNIEDINEFIDFSATLKVIKNRKKIKLPI